MEPRFKIHPLIPQRCYCSSQHGSEAGLSMLNCLCHREEAQGRAGLATLGWSRNLSIGQCGHFMVLELEGRDGLRVRDDSSVSRLKDRGQREDDHFGPVRGRSWCTGMDLRDNCSGMRSWDLVALRLLSVRSWVREEEGGKEEARCGNEAEPGGGSEPGERQAFGAQAGVHTLCAPDH